MALIEGMKIKNYRSLRNVSFGRTWQDRDVDPLTPLTVVIGKNGAGKALYLMHLVSFLTV
ncbi:hypothetical protein [Halomonas denitrificans]|uniref:hypothetical protein n=1 Tax=Halomonas denitrificans TaxID=370769 RepID=UPI001B86A303|nr:hypothetical protein [Halomonas denitrificans]